MALKITKNDDLYAAMVTPPHSHITWSTSAPLPLRELIQKLREHGCHQQDIGDALYEIDADWTSKLN